MARVKESTADIEPIEGHLSAEAPPPAAARAIDWAARFARRTAGQGDPELTSILALANAGDDLLTFSGGFPEPATFDAEVLGEIARRLVREDAAIALQYAPSEGVTSVREYLCDRVCEQEGTRPSVDEMLVTSGGIDGMELLSKSLVDPGDVVVCESPSYLGAIMGFRSYEADVRGIPMDEDGMEVDVLEGWLRDGVTPKFVYVIPEHQNPSGLTLSVERRRALVALCRRHGVLILEDVAYRELRYEGEILPSLWSMGPDVVVQLGTFSKVLSPGVRLGWAVGPPALIAQMAVAKQNADQCTGAFGQRLLEAYGRAGHFPAHLVKARAVYARRWELTDAALRAHMPSGCTWTEPTGGFFTWLELPGDVDTVSLRAAATEHGVAFVPGTPFYPDQRPSNAMRIAFSRMADDRIDEGVRRLARAVQSADGSSISAS